MPYEAKDRSLLQYHQERYDSLVQDNDLALADRVASYLLAIVWSIGVAGVAGAAGDYAPHDTSYTAYAKTRGADRTVKSDGPELTDSMTRKEKGAAREEWKKTATVKVINQETQGTPAHFLKNRSMRQLDIQLECVAAAQVSGCWYFAANTLVILDCDVMNTLRELGTPHAPYKVVYDMTPNLHAEMKVLKYLRERGISLNGIAIGVSKPCCPRCKEVLDRESVRYTSYHNTAVDANRWTAPF